MYFPRPFYIFIFKKVSTTWILKQLLSWVIESRSMLYLIFIIKDKSSYSTGTTFWRWLSPENPNAYLDSWDWISLPTCPTGGFLVMFSLENSIQSLTWEMRELVSPQPSRTLFLENCQALCPFFVHASKTDTDWH